MKTKFIFISLQIRNGEYEYSSHSTHEISARKNIEKFGRNYLNGFYAGKSFKFSPEDKWTYFNGSEVAARLITVEEISKAEFDVLNKFQHK